MHYKNLVCVGVRRVGQKKARLGTRSAADWGEGSVSNECRRQRLEWALVFFFLFIFREGDMIKKPRNFIILHLIIFLLFEIFIKSHFIIFPKISKSLSYSVYHISDMINLTCYEFQSIFSVHIWQFTKICTVFDFIIFQIFQKLDHIMFYHIIIKKKLYHIHFIIF